VLDRICGPLADSWLNTRTPSGTVAATGGPYPIRLTLGWSVKELMVHSTDVEFGLATIWRIWMLCSKPLFQGKEKGCGADTGST
jgi:hypothetical protein